MIAEPLDPRVKRTRAQLGSAVRELLRERDPAGISITDITSVAKVSRPTFYLHYTSPDDLLAETVRRDLDVLAGSAAVPRPEDTGPPQALLELIGELNRVRWLYRCLVSQTTSFGQSRGEVVSYLTEHVRDLILLRQPEVPYDRALEAAHFVAGGTLALLSTWLADPEPAGEDEVRAFGERVWGLLSGVLEGLV
ncbi:TetR/AcrR family transcriptional regulator [Kineosporia babensis]|uniref:TetR/AcrR family transcriptional regulator n=1 Tax=Kineosporia babensis TaxID=499548 RepID=A0A9X1NK53_9ACTN|nr:TetR/AcrR family transcriptional regulator [Kineosporia babensis]MCD5315079.1 TetR/AcrR family transcriptional regulator [Kineosporia babensis]